MGAFEAGGLGEIQGSCASFLVKLKPRSHWIKILGNFTTTMGNIPMG